MTRIRLAAAAVILLGGLALATASDAAPSTHAGMCPTGACWWNGQCIKPCP
jgi:hypothetical protein